MPWLVPDRRDIPELMDQPNQPEEEIQAAYQALKRLNRWFGTLRIVRNQCRVAFEQRRAIRGEIYTIVDLGAGSGDVALALQQSSGNLTAASDYQIIALDAGDRAVALSSARGLQTVQGSILQLPFRDQSIESVIAIKFAHHFSGPELDAFFGELCRVARHHVFVLDLRRHWLAWLGFWLLSRTLFRSRIFRYDGLVSVLRGFTQEEVMKLVEGYSDFGWTFLKKPFFHFALIGFRRD